MFDSREVGYEDEPMVTRRLVEKVEEIQETRRWPGCDVYGLGGEER